METPIHSSFIPTQDSQPQAVQVEYGRTAGDILVLLGLLALIIAGAVSAGVFLYHQYATSLLAQGKEQLALGEKSFSTEALSQLMRLDERLVVAESILQNHTAPSVLFQILQETTLKSIQFTTLEYSHQSNEIKVSMKGKAASVNAIALQANMFSRHAAIQDPIFQINEFTKDGVTFSVTMLLNYDAVRYQSLIEASRQARTPVSQEPAQVTEGEESFFESSSAPSADSARPTPNRGAAGGSTTAPEEGFGDFNAEE